MIAEKLNTQCFDRIYSTDLVYVKDCWTLCGDAHCCSFARYKAKFGFFAQTPFQELLLLPGEYEYLEQRGWLEQFGDYEHKVIQYPLSEGMLKVESIISRRPNCACNHDTRPAICRLYPLLPAFDIDGRVLSVEPFGIYEELEQIGGLTSACQLTSLPFSQLSKFLEMTSELARVPLFLFYLKAYSLAKRHVSARIHEAYQEYSGEIFNCFEIMFIRKTLFDHDELRSDLDALVEQFRVRYSEQFQLNG